MALGGDIVQLTHNMQIGAVDVLNVYYFEAVDGTADIEVLGAWFNTNVVPLVKAAQQTGVTHEQLALVNLFDTGEIYEVALSGTGSQTGTDAFTSFHAGSIRLVHNTAGLRDGFKRIGASVEGNASGNAWLAAQVTALENIAAKLLNPLSPTLATWAHVIVGRVKEIDVVTGETTYRLPEIQAEVVVGYPTSYDVSTVVTSQVSRKYRPVI